MDPLMTPEEVATVVRRNAETVRRWARSGKLRSAGRLPDGGWLFSRADVEALIGGSPAPARSKQEMAAHAEAAYARALQRSRRQA